MFYSDATKGFYNYGEMPSDVVEISGEYYNELLNGQATGLKISVDERGYPVLVESIPAPPTLEELTADAVAKRDQLLALAAIRIAPLQDAVDLGDPTPEEEALLIKWKTYRRDVNRVSQQTTYPSVIDWPVEPA